MNALMPVSIAAGLGWMAALAGQVSLETDAAAGVGLTFIITMLTLALIEHVMLVLPFAKLWSWAVTERRAAGRDALLIAPKPGCTAGCDTHIKNHVEAGTARAAAT